MNMNQPTTVTIKPHPREVVREFLEACKNHGSGKFYEEVVAELKTTLNPVDITIAVEQAISEIENAEDVLFRAKQEIQKAKAKLELLLP